MLTWLDFPGFRRCT